SYDLIGSVKAQGYSITEQHYELRDNNPVHGLQYYRLKSIDFDGSFEYSKNIAVYYGPESVFEVIALSPNKASNNISIDFAYNSNKDLHIVITDIVGKVIHEEVFSRTSGENHHLDISADFSSAFYFITFYNEDLKETKKLSFQ
ncbi:MAG: T9SS type A sorting domain-containing protein, partial [Bacteroidia bacterium]|nr:T9SS type A sorting domain-containing protein [Bacteroidia bacterium]